MKNNIKKVIILTAALVAGVAGLFVYQVQKVRHYTPQTAEIIVSNHDVIETAFMLKNDEPVSFSLAEHLTFISDVENGTAVLPDKKTVFGFYECDAEYAYDEYNPAVSYTSSDESRVTVDENGTVTAHSKGQAVVTVTADAVTCEIPVTVYRIVAVSELEQGTVLLKGETKSLLTLEEYELPAADFYSSDEKVAKVDENGTVIAISKGKAQIYTFKDPEQTEKVTADITVKQPVESASMKARNIYVGRSITLKATYSPQNADYGTTFTYTSSNPDVVSISGNTAKGVKEGEAIITATSANGVAAKARVTVTKQPVATATITPVKKSEFEKYDGEKYTDDSPYASYFKITFDQPVIGFRLNVVNDDGTTKTTGRAIYNNAQVPAGTPLYFGVCINQSDVVDTRGFSYVNQDGSKVSYSIHLSLKDSSGTVLKTKY